MPKLLPTQLERLNILYICKHSFAHFCKSLIVQPLQISFSDSLNFTATNSCPAILPFAREDKCLRRSDLEKKGKELLQIIIRYFYGKMIKDKVEAKNYPKLAHELMIFFLRYLKADRQMNE